MCYFEQTQYLACGHNVEMVMEKCELGERYRTSMHDKIITAIHTDDGKCEVCSPPPAYVEDSTTGSTEDLSNGTTSDLPDVAPTNGPISYPDLGKAALSEHPDLTDLTTSKSTSEKRPVPERKDSIGEGLMDLD